MGLSTTRAAARTLDALMTLAAIPGDKSSNTFGAGNRTYFYEVNRRDEEDGGIRGDVQENTVGGNCRYTGQFHIRGDGTIRRFPGTTPKQHREAEAKAKSPTFRESGIARI